MKTLNLNIKTSDLKLSPEEAKLSPSDLTKRFIDIAFGMYQSQPDPRGQPRGMQVAEQRRVYKILDALEKAKDKVELEDDWFDLLYEVFNAVKWIGGTKVVVRIADRLEEAKSEKNINKEPKGKD